MQNSSNCRWRSWHPSTCLGILTWWIGLCMCHLEGYTTVALELSILQTSFARLQHSKNLNSHIVINANRTKARRGLIWQQALGVSGKTHTIEPHEVDVLSNGRDNCTRIWSPTHDYKGNNKSTDETNVPNFTIGSDLQSPLWLQMFALATPWTRLFAISVDFGWSWLQILNTSRDEYTECAVSSRRWNDAVLSLIDYRCLLDMELDVHNAVSARHDDIDSVFWDYRSYSGLESCQLSCLFKHFRYQTGLRLISTVNHGR